MKKRQLVFNVGIMLILSSYQPASVKAASTTAISYRAVSETTIPYPTLYGRLISPCMRDEKGKTPCSPDAKNIAANKYCQHRPGGTPHAISTGSHWRRSKPRNKKPVARWNVRIGNWELPLENKRRRFITITCLNRVPVVGEPKLEIIR